MTPHWEPLHATGTNYYAFGAPKPGNRYAERSDPASPLYQAWIGVYAIDTRDRR
jgi:hypothetical protein